MATIAFDGWETQFYGGYLPDGYGGQDYLMHFRTRGSKNGVRRYQNPDGTWTPLGLKERAEREGWGERRAARKEARRAAKAERRAAKAAARSENLARARQYKAEQAEARRKRNPKNLTDEELRTGIERLKMEQEYRELSKSPALKVGERLVEKYMEYRTAKIEAKNKEEERKYQYAKLATDRANTRDRAAADKLRAKADAAQAKADLAEVRKGKKAAANQAKLVGAKLAYRNTTIRGGIGAFFNKTLRSLAEHDDSIRKGRAEVEGMLSGRKAVDRYNRSHENKATYAATPDQVRRAKQSHEKFIEREKTKQEEWKARQKGSSK